MAGGAFTVLFTIVLTIGVVRVLNQTAGGGYEIGSIFEVVAYSSLVNLPPLIALSLFLSVLVTLNRTWRDSEMYVWFSSGGLSLASWIAPVLRFAVPIAILVGACSLVLSPWSRAQVQSFRERIAQKEDINKLSSGRFIEFKNGRQVIFLDRIDQEKGEVGNLFMTQTKPDGSRSVLTAQSGGVQTLPDGDRYIVLNNGRRYDTEPSGLGATITEFKQYRMRMDNSVPEASVNSRVDSMTFSELLDQKGRKAQAEIFWRLCWPLLAVNLALLAIPLSHNNPRAVKYYGQIAAVLIFIVCLNALSIGQTWINQGKWTILEGLLYLNVPPMLLTIYLFYRQMTLNANHFDTRIWNLLTAPLRRLRQRKLKKEEAGPALGPELPVPANSKKTPEFEAPAETFEKKRQEDLSAQAHEGALERRRTRRRKPKEASNLKCEEAQSVSAKESDPAVSLQKESAAPAKRRRRRGLRPAAKESSK